MSFDLQDELRHKSVFYICECCGEQITYEINCGDRTCLRCGRKRKHAILQHLDPIVATMKTPIFLTLTLTRRRLSRLEVSRLRSFFTKLRHRKIWRGTKGGFYNIELGTINVSGSVNMHIHCLFDGNYIPHSDLKKAWKKITGDSWIVDIRKCWSKVDAMDYLTKHFLKIAKRSIGQVSVEGVRLSDGLTDSQIELINRSLKGTRLIQGFGTYFSLNLDSCMPTCPNCGALDSWVCVWDEDKFHAIVVRFTPK